jgi:hypothetical protein
MCEKCKVKEDEVLIEVRVNDKLERLYRFCEDCAEKYLNEKD